MQFKIAGAGASQTPLRANQQCSNILSAPATSVNGLDLPRRWLAPKPNAEAEYRLSCLDDLFQPGHAVLHAEAPRLDALDHVPVYRGRIRGNRIAIDSQKDINDGEGNPLVPVEKRMALNKAFEQCRGLVNERVIVAGPGAVKG